MRCEVRIVVLRKGNVVCGRWVAVLVVKGLRILFIREC